MSYDAILIVGHGSRDSAGAAEIAAIAPLVRALAGPHIAVEVGYLELSDPPATEVLHTLARNRARHIVIVPFMVSAAGHTRSDVPAVVITARQAYPDITFTYTEPLGDDFVLLDLARTALSSAGGMGKPLAVFFRGASEPWANAEAYKIARLLAELNNSPSFFVGFSGITWPSIKGALDQVAAAGIAELATFSWFIAPGILIDRIDLAVASFGQETGLRIFRAGYLGIGPRIAKLVIDRVEAAVAGQVRTPCDLCSYRRPFPGLEERVGAARGIGHSHLASEHQAGHDHRHHRHNP
ncbi:MAG: sirohydrochlorin chelatase [Actinomycetota bacterium]|nr:sirohydrochlorin chelatase [Actinomycetota bacterium]